jgi:hypothetical protein
MPPANRFLTIAFVWSAVVLASYYAANADYYVAKVSTFLAFLKPVLGG